MGNERIVEMQGNAEYNCEACPVYKDIMARIHESEDRTDRRMSKLEGEVSDVFLELRELAESTICVKTNINTMLLQQTQMGVDIKELRTDMLGLVTTTLQQSRTDMNTWMQMTEKHRQEQEERDKNIQAKSEEKDKAFYRKLILTCISVLVTIVLTFFGIKAIIPILPG